MEQKIETNRQSVRRYYGEYYAELVAAKEILDMLCAELEQDFTIQRGHSPIEHVKSRLKAPFSTAEKLSRLRAEKEAISTPRDLYDIVGMRIVCTFIDDVYAVRTWFAAHPDLMVVTEKDYIRHPKMSGYRSYHLQIKVRINENVWVKAEIQIRTITMDCWASLEHQLRYKKHLLNADMMASELKRCADEMASTDLNLMTIRDHIIYKEPDEGDDPCDY